MEEAGVDVPKSVTGAYLYCNMADKADAAQIDVSCRLNDSSSVKMAITSIAKRSAFSFVSPVSSVVIKTIPLNLDPKFDVRYEFSGLALDKLRDAALVTTYQVDFFDLNDGSPHASKQGLGSNIIQSTVLIPTTTEAKIPATTKTPLPAPTGLTVTPADSLRWMSEFDADKNGFCNNTECCLFDGGGLTWQLDKGVPMSYAEAEAFCENATDGGFDNWQLPTEEALNLAASIKTKVAPAMLLDITAQPYWLYFTGDRTTKQRPYMTVAVSPIKTTILETEKLRVLCVRPAK